MKRIVRYLLFACIGALLIPLSQAQAKLDRKTTIDVNAIAPRDVYASLSRLLGYELSIAPEIQKPVTMHLEDVTVRTALTALSENLGCRWSISGNTLHVESGRPGPAGNSGRGIGAGRGAGIGSGMGSGIGGGAGPRAGAGAGRGVITIVESGRNGEWRKDFKRHKQNMECIIPSGFRFENAELGSVMDALGRICNMEIRLDESDKARKVTIDLSNRKILSALKAISEQAALQKPIMILMGKPSQNGGK